MICRINLSIAAPELEKLPGMGTEQVGWVMTALLLAYGVGQIVGSMIGEEWKGTVQVFSFVLFLLLLDPVKRKLQTMIENRFFPQRRDYSTQLTTYSSEIMEVSPSLHSSSTSPAWTGYVNVSTSTSGSGPSARVMIDR